MAKLKPFILPIAIVLGLLLHSYVMMVTWLIPYVIFTILLLNFSAVDILSLRINKLDCFIMAFQTIVSIGGYALIKLLFSDTILAEGWLMAILCPVASSVVVVAAAIGADRKTTTGYTIYGNMLVAVVAPLIFAMIGTSSEVTFFETSCTIFGKISSVIALPFFVALVLQKKLPRVSKTLSRYKEYTFGLWAFALLVTLGQTISYIFKYYHGNESTIMWLGVITTLGCAVQFGIGKLIGSRYGERTAGGQMLGQKNTALGIWMTSLYLNPLSSVSLAFYCVAQNVFNSWQIWRYQKNQTKVCK